MGFFNANMKPYVAQSKKTFIPHFVKQKDCSKKKKKNIKKKKTKKTKHRNKYAHEKWVIFCIIYVRVLYG